MINFDLLNYNKTAAENKFYSCEIKYGIVSFTVLHFAMLHYYSLLIIKHNFGPALRLQQPFQYLFPVIDKHLRYAVTLRFFIFYFVQDTVIKA